MSCHIPSLGLLSRSGLSTRLDNPLSTLVSQSHRTRSPSELDDFSASSPLILWKTRSAQFGNSGCWKGNAVNAKCASHLSNIYAMGVSYTGRYQRASKANIRHDISSHRAVAIVRLLRIEEGGAYADVLGGHATNSMAVEMNYVDRSLGFRVAELESRERKLVTEEVAGVIRWKRYLDYLIYTFYSGDERNYDRMEPLLRQILRLGVYEIVKLDVPPHAAVNENVKLAKVALRAGAGNMVNGLLRTVLTNKAEGKLPSPSVDGDERAQARALATIHSHPVWMVRRWLARYGMNETVNLLMWNNKRPTFSVRANSARGMSQEKLSSELAKLEVAHVPSPYLESFIRLSTGMQDLLQAGLVQAGFCAVQDESAGLVVRLVNPQPGDTILDCCAAPGGKALFVASLLEGQGNVMAVDVNEGRLQMVKEAAEQQNLSHVVTIYHSDIRDLHPRNAADRVLLDAPCSGLGVLSKRADLRWRRAAEDFKVLTDLQDELLEAAAKLVRPGGILVYSTCSIEPEENSVRVTTFLRKHPEFAIESAEKFVPKHMVSSEGFFVSEPHKDQIDGAFAARLRHKRP